jgi:hypothetical protein
MQKIAPLLVLFAAFILAPVRAEDPDTIKVSEFTFSFSKPWIRQQVTSPMRAGQFTYDHAEEALADVDMVIFFFGAGQGGGTQANIDRWLSQFEGAPESKTEEKEMGGKQVTLVTAKGTYLDSMGGPMGPKTPKPDYTMLAAILPSPEGDVFLKVTGPNASVAAMQEAFMAFIASPFAQ